MEIPEDRNPGGLTRSRAHAHSGGQQSPGPLLPLRQASAPKPSGKAWPRAPPLVRAPPLRRAPPHPGPAHLSMMPFMRMALFQSLRVDLPARCTNSFGLMTCSSYCGEEQSGVRTGLPAAPLRQPSAQSRPRCPSACRSASPVAMPPLGRGLGRLSPQPGAAAPRQAPSRPPGNTVHSYIHHGIDWRPARGPQGHPLHSKGARPTSKSGPVLWARVRWFHPPAELGWREKGRYLSHLVRWAITGTEDPQSDCVYLGNEQPGGGVTASAEAGTKAPALGRPAVRVGPSGDRPATGAKAPELADRPHQLPSSTAGACCTNSRFVTTSSWADLSVPFPTAFAPCVFW